MKQYLAVFVAPIEAYDKMKEDMQKMSPEELEQSMEGWKQWMSDNSTSIADPGGAVGSAKSVRKDSVSDIRNTIGGYMIVEAKSADEAAKLFEDSPVFDMDGASVEVMEVTQM